jgi:uncharacterized protein (TIGR02466 family)
MNCQLQYMFPTAVGMFDSYNHAEYKRMFLDRMPHHCIRHESGAGLISGENTGMVYIHTDPALRDLFGFVSKCVASYMEQLRMDVSRFDINIVKTWISATDNKTTTPFHAHATSHFSFVYYMKMPKEADALMFQISKSPNEPYYGAFFESNYRQRSLVTERNWLNSNSATIVPTEGQLLVFPSHLLHGTVKVGDMGDENRISLAGDVLLVFNEDRPNYATGVFDPSTWRVFN